MSDSAYENPRLVKDVAACEFYHTMELPQLGVCTGAWDLRGRVREYIGGVDLKDKRVLDVGTASGFLTFEMEAMGADVVSFDAGGLNHIQFLPYKSHPVWANREEWLNREAPGLERLRNSYWLAHRLMQSQARVFYGDVYNIPPSVGRFDVVVVGQILVHLRDPIGALSSIVDRCADTLVIAEGMIDSPTPHAAFLPRATSNDPGAVWWHYSTGLYKEVLAMMDFSVEQVTTQPYRCNAADKDISISTLVARRRTSRQ